VRHIGLLLLLLVSCRPRPLNAADGVLRVGSTLDFGDVWRGAHVTRKLDLHNVGLAPLDLSLSVDAPFDAPAAVQLMGGAELQVVLGFSPSMLGHASATLSLQSSAGLAQVLLLGNGVEPPPCEPSSCRTAVLDPVTSACIQSPKSDGTSCSDACLKDAMCLAGDCVGSAASSCDDGDPCTTDACDPVSGCVHAAVQCASTDPCNAPTCDPAAGCTAHPAPDGTSCGDSDCSTAHVCISGQCVTRAVPDGAECGHGSICRPVGHCQSQQCVQAPATLISRSWMYAPTNKRLAAIVGDEENNLFITECVPGGNFISQCQLVAFDPTGVERWRTPFTHSVSADVALRDALLIAHGLIVSTIAPDWVDVFDKTSGKSVWSLDLKTLGLFPAGAYPRVRPLSVGFDGAELVLALEGENQGLTSGDAVITLDLSSGALGHTVPLPAQGFSLLIDRPGRTYLSHSSGASTGYIDAVTAFDPAFGVRWQKTLNPVQNTIRQMLATRGGELLLSAYDHSELLSTQNGAVATSTLGAYWFSGAPVWGSNALFARHQYCAMASCNDFSDYTVDLETVDDVSRAKHASRLSPYAWASDSWLTTSQTALLSLWPAVAGAKPEVREIDAKGQVLMACPLEMSKVDMVAGPVLGNGRYAAITGDVGYPGDEHLEVWALTGYSPALSGWVSPRGGRSLDLREQ
jgi:hypothetical protein